MVMIVYRDRDLSWILCGGRTGTGTQIRKVKQGTKRYTLKYFQILEPHTNEEGATAEQAGNRVTDRMMLTGQLGWQGGGWKGRSQSFIRVPVNGDGEW